MHSTVFSTASSCLAFFMHFLLFLDSYLLPVYPDLMQLFARPALGVLPTSTPPSRNLWIKQMKSSSTKFICPTIAYTIYYLLSVQPLNLPMIFVHGAISSLSLMPAILTGKVFSLDACINIDSRETWATFKLGLVIIFTVFIIIPLATLLSNPVS